MRSDLPKKPKFEGPFRIREKHGAVNYSIENVNETNRRVQKVHINRLIPFEQRREGLKLAKEIQKRKPIFHYYHKNQNQNLILTVRKIFHYLN